MGRDRSADERERGERRDGRVQAQDTRCEQGGGRDERGGGERVGTDDQAGDEEGEDEVARVRARRARDAGERRRFEHPLDR